MRLNICEPFLILLIFLQKPFSKCRQHPDCKKRGGSEPEHFNDTKSLSKRGEEAASSAGAGAGGAGRPQQVEMTAVLPPVISTVEGQLRSGRRKKSTLLLNWRLCAYNDC